MGDACHTAYSLRGLGHSRIDPKLPFLAGGGGGLRESLTEKYNTVFPNFFFPTPCMRGYEIST